mmetsp:Transcript_18308/g.57964  ORF Transcript_18308/g.57964 Transcript_18308/m.57964 type:complete len:251 (-) Transcript_18308:758-1510(-)
MFSAPSTSSWRMRRRRRRFRLGPQRSCRQLRRPAHLRRQARPGQLFRPTMTAPSRPRSTLPAAKPPPRLSDGPRLARPSVLRPRRARRRRRPLGAIPSPSHPAALLLPPLPPPSAAEPHRVEPRRRRRPPATLRRPRRRRRASRCRQRRRRSRRCNRAPFASPVTPSPSTRSSSRWNAPSPAPTTSAAARFRWPTLPSKRGWARWREGWTSCAQWGTSRCTATWFCSGGIRPSSGWARPLCRRRSARWRT